jgi:hypothetical protein
MAERLPAVLGAQRSIRGGGDPHPLADRRVPRAHPRPGHPQGAEVGAPLVEEDEEISVPPRQGGLDLNDAEPQPRERAPEGGEARLPAIQTAGGVHGGLRHPGQSRIDSPHELPGGNRLGWSGGPYRREIPCQQQQYGGNDVERTHAERAPEP